MFMNANTKMKLIVAMSILTLIRAEYNQSVYIINGVRHQKEILFENLDQLFNLRDNKLVVDHKTNNLYVDWHTNGKAAVLHINSKYHVVPITGLSKIQCITVDQLNHDVFVGTANGIYKYDEFTGAVEYVGAQGEDVWRIYHYNGALYYKKFETREEIRKLVNGQSVRYHEFAFDISDFVIDSEENIFCTKYNYTLCRYNDATNNTFVYEGVPAVKSFTTDIFGNVYFSVKDGIYKVKGDSVERVVNITNPRYIAFDSDNNLIYYNDKEYKLYRLKPINIPNVQSEFLCEEEVTNNNDIKTELQIMNKKIDDLQEVINMLLTNITEKQLAHTDSLGTIHLDNIVLKNINISIGLDESGVAQIPST